MAVLLGLSACYLFLAESSAFVIWIAFLPFLFFSFYGFWPGVGLSAGVLALALIAFYSPANQELHVVLTSEMRMMFLSIMAITILVGIALTTLTTMISNRLTSMAVDYRRVAFYDALTGIHSHAYLVRWFEENRHSFKDDDKVSLLFIDVDNLKSINDTQGHLAGNETLIAVADALGQEPHDILVRWGGDEFLIIRLGIDRDEALSMADELRKRVSGLKLESDPSVPITISIGVTVHTLVPDLTLNGLIKEADAQLAKSKQLGKNRVCIQDQE